MSNTSLLGSFGGQGDSSLMFRNKIINGDMRIDQRNAGAAVTPTTGGYFTVDRWSVTATQSSKFSIQQNAGAITPPLSFSNYCGLTSLSSYSITASDIFLLNQLIEGFNVADFGWGAAGAQTVVLSFWVRSSLTGTFGGALRNSAGNRSYPFTYSISVANTWEQKTVVIPGDTSGTWLTNNGVGIRLSFGLGVGSTYSGAAGAWAGSDFYSATGATSVVGTNGATLYITGVQLEAGPVATPFERRPYSVELSMCQRYYYKVDTANGHAKNVSGFCIGGQNYAFIFVTPPVTMRSNPVLTHNLDNAQYTSGNPSGTQWTFIQDGNTYATKTGAAIFAQSQTGVGVYQSSWNVTARPLFGPNVILEYSAEL